MSSRRSAIPADSLLQLRQRLDRLPPKSPERATQIAAAAQLYGISVTTVYLLWGLFDEEMYVEFTGETWGPYYPVSGPVPLHSYRTFRRGKAAERADRIHALARQLNIPISALSGSDLRVVSDDTQQRIDELPHQPFDVRKFEYHFPTVIAAKLAIADDLAIPLARMPDEDRAFIDSILTETLNRNEVLARIRDYFRNRQSGEDHAG